ncbi:MAG: phosphoribosylamine--glycine ligase [Bacteroidales bacterium]
MNVLILGSGGREHALAWKISQSKALGKLFCMPGNPGTKSVANNIPGNINDFSAVEKTIVENKIELLIVGPENPLVEGIKDYFAEHEPQLMFIGPDKKGSALEGSKDFAKKFMFKYNIPTAKYKSFTSSTENDAHTFLSSLKAPYVLKADGLAAGKGVMIIDTLDQAKNELSQMLGGKFGVASGKVVIEEFLKGIELSIFVLTDGQNYLILPEAKDYKRIGEGDTGLNTGGMGAVSPVPFATTDFMKKVEERIIKPTITGIQKEGMDYRGFIFIGLMNCNGDPYVIEYNVRMGDPETEAVMTRIDSDFLGHLISAAKKELDKEKIIKSEHSAVTVVVVSGGYPEKYTSNYPISGLEVEEGINIFHSGTKEIEGKIVTSGGRVLAITSNEKNIFLAKKKAFNALKKIYFKDCYYRKDIADDLLNL